VEVAAGRAARGEIGYRAAVRRNLALVVLLSLQGMVAALALLIHLGARVSVVEAYRAYDTAMPWMTAVAVSGWLLPGALGVAGALDLVAIAAPMRRSRRAALVSAGLCVSSGALIFAVLAAFLPIFRAE
jgi:hypothetical protein